MNKKSIFAKLLVCFVMTVCVCFFNNIDAKAYEEMVSCKNMYHKVTYSDRLKETGEFGNKKAPMQYTYYKTAYTLTITGGNGTPFLWGDAEWDYKKNDYNYTCAIKMIAPNVKRVSINNCKLDNSVRYMFADLTKLEEVQFYYVDASNVMMTWGMFSKNPNLKTVNFINTKMPSLTRTEYMYQQNPKLTTIDMSCLDTSKVYSATGMFEGCKSLTSVKLRAFDQLSDQEYKNLFVGTPLEKKVPTPVR